MKRSRLLGLSLILMVLSTLSVGANMPRIVDAQAVLGTPRIFVWSNTCRDSNVSSTNPSCGTLTLSTTFIVQINVTNAPDFNGVDITLYYDPVHLKAEAVDEAGSGATRTLFRSPFIATLDLATEGVVRVSVVDLVIGPITSRNGTLVHITFTVNSAEGVSPLTLSASVSRPSSDSKSSTRLVLGNTPIEATTSDGYFTNAPGKLGPVADFTYSPPAPIQGGNVIFDASASFDPDNLAAGNQGIAGYKWDFDDGNGISGTAPVTEHDFRHLNGRFFFGNFSVRLTVTDADNGFVGMKTLRVEVTQQPLHDVSVSIRLEPQRVRPGEQVQVRLTVFNEGTFQETFNLTVNYGPPARELGSAASQDIAPNPPNDEWFRTFTLDTSGLAPGKYTISANVTIAIDDDPSDNSENQVLDIVEEFQTLLPLYAAGGLTGLAGIIVAVALLRRRSRKQKAV